MKIRNFKKIIHDSARFEISDRRNDVPVGDFVIASTPTRHVGRWFPIALKTALTVSFLFLLSLYVYLRVTPVTTLTIDINPTIYIRLNAFDKVVSYVAPNAESEEFIAELHLKNDSVATVMAKVYDRANELGYVTESNVFALVGIYSIDYETEMNLKTVIDNASGFTTLALLNHEVGGVLATTSSISIMYSQYISSNDFATEESSAELDDFSPISGDAADGTVWFYIDDTYTYSIGSTVDMEDISATRLALVAEIFLTSDDYDSEDDFNNLMAMDIASLISIYDSLQ